MVGLPLVLLPKCVSPFFFTKDGLEAAKETSIEQVIKKDSRGINNIGKVLAQGTDGTKTPSKKKKKPSAKGKSSGEDKGPRMCPEGFQPFDFKDINGKITPAQMLRHEMGALLMIYATRNVNKIFSQAEWNPNNLKQERALGIIADIFGYSTAGKAAIKAAQERFTVGGLKIIIMGAQVVAAHVASAIEYLKKHDPGAYKGIFAAAGVYIHKTSFINFRPRRRRSMRCGYARVAEQLPGCQGSPLDARR